VFVGFNQPDRLILDDYQANQKIKNPDYQKQSGLNNET